MATFSVLAGAEGLDSRRCDAKPSIFRLCYAPRSVAALTCHRHVIHYRSPSSPSNSIPAKTEKGRRLATFFCFGRGRRTRTHDPWFWRPVLYQLSYTPVQRGILYHTSSKKARGFSKKVSVFLIFFVSCKKILCRPQVTCIKYLDSTQNMWYNSRMEKDFSPILPPFPRRIPS